MTTIEPESAFLARQLSVTRKRLEKAINLTVTLSQRNSELRAAITATLNENPSHSYTLRRLREVMDTKGGEDE